VLDPVSRLGLSIAVILVVAKVAGDAASRLKLPTVLGELLGGILLGALPVAFFERIRSDAYVDVLARLGILILLFEVGLETTVREVLQVGFASVRVAVLGTVGTLLVGWAATAAAVPDAGTPVHLFFAAALTATSVGISARVLKDVGAGRSREAPTILSAAVIDDVLGLVVLVVIAGAGGHSGAGAGVTPLGIGWLVAKTSVFLAVAIAVGVKLSPAIFRFTARLRTSGALVAAGLTFCFVLAGASDAIGLAPIVGAFTAGLILEESHSASFVARGERSLADRMEPISSWLVPIFFVLMGMRADLRALTHPSTLLLALVLALAAVVGKLPCALGAPRGTDRVAVALGMMPRGEVSLVFASLGLSNRLLDPAQYSALVAVVVLTTLTAPVALRWRLLRRASLGGQP
jgi:Kef-type K+ transport system membrane component KefB